MCFLHVLMVVLLRAAKGGVTHLHLRQCPPGEFHSGQTEFWSQLCCPPGSLLSAYPAVSLDFLSICQVILIAVIFSFLLMKIRRVKLSLSVRDLTSTLLRNHFDGFVAIFFSNAWSGRHVPDLPWPFYKGIISVANTCCCFFAFHLQYFQRIKEPSHQCLCRGTAQLSCLLSTNHMWNRERRTDSDQPQAFCYPLKVFHLEKFHPSNLKHCFSLPPSKSLFPDVLLSDIYNTFFLPLSLITSLGIFFFFCS